MARYCIPTLINDKPDTCIIYVGTKGLIQNVPVKKVKAFETEYLDFLDAKHRDVLDQLKAGKYTDALMEVLGKVAKEIASKY